MSSEFQVDQGAIAEFLDRVLTRQLDAKAKQWFSKKLKDLKQYARPKDLFLVFSAIPRFLGRQDLLPSAQEVEEASRLRDGLQIQHWSVPQAARVLIICTYPYADEDSFLKILDQILSSAEVSELVALYSALPLLPYPEKLPPRASEGIRTNMSVVFDAVVLNNPYPSEYLDEGAWNQMVLKALFMGRPLYLIVGLERRCNSRLSKMISYFAHERWAAGRDTSPEMWRPIGNQPSGSIYEDLEKLMAMDDMEQKAAAVLTAHALNSPEANTFLERHASLINQLQLLEITWDEIGKRWWSQQSS